MNLKLQIPLRSAPYPEPYKIFVIYNFHLTHSHNEEFHTIVVPKSTSPENGLIIALNTRK